MRRNRQLVGVCAAVAALGGCGDRGDGHKVARREFQVFAAASLTEAFRKVGAGFETSHPEAQVELNFAGSQQLATEIRSDAPADVFASADLTQMEAAERSGRIDSRDVREFAENSLVIVAYPGSKITRLQDLTLPDTKIVLAAKEVPAGRYAVKFLQLADRTSPGFEKAVLERVSSYELDVRSVLSKVRLGEADAGIVYRSDALSAGSGVKVVPAGPDLNVATRYYIAPVRGSNERTARDFVSYVLSPTGQKVLVPMGFLPARSTE